MAKITLENLEFHAFHGCLEHEKIHGNTFLVTLEMELDTLLAGTTDELTDTLNYQLVYDVIKEEMETPSKLIEHVAQRIVDKIISTFSEVKIANIKLCKMNPPLGGKANAVCIEIKKTN